MVHHQPTRRGLKKDCTASAVFNSIGGFSHAVRAAADDGRWPFGWYIRRNHGNRPAARSAAIRKASTILAAGTADSTGRTPRRHHRVPVPATADDATDVD